MPEKFEAIVVGCGPAGAAAALELAKNGVQVLVLERGRTAGAKNVTGGILYGSAETPYNLDYVLPNFEKEAPLERAITKYFLHALSGNKVKTIDLFALHAHNTKYAYSVLRSKFDAWLADKVHEATRRSGGGLLASIRVTGPLIENGRIVGVQCAELDPIRADVIVAADGATSEMVRGAGIRDWMTPEKWFQGVKAVLKMPAELLETRFNIGINEGAAHLFAGDIFGQARGGGFLYTNKDTLSIGTVFHLDSVVAAGLEPHSYLDKMLSHPLLREWIGDHYEEVEYSAKLIPDGKKAFLAAPYKDNMLAVGDAANQMQAAGPIIKGMNLGITAGILAARSYVEAKKKGNTQMAGALYAQALKESYIASSLQGDQALKKALSFLTTLGEPLLRNPLFSPLLKSPLVAKGIEKTFSNYRLSESAPDKTFVYTTLPSLLAKYQGREVSSNKKISPLSLDERIAALAYDTDIGHPHIDVKDPSLQASGACVSSCPVSAKDSSRGCYRVEDETINGQKIQKVVLDTQPCVECGTCAVVGKTSWQHPSGGKGVEYKFG